MTDLYHYVKLNDKKRPTFIYLHHIFIIHSSFSAFTVYAMLIMSQSIPWLPIPPPGRLSGICHFGEKMLQMPHHGVQIMQQNPHPWGLTLTQMPHPWGQNISFLRIFEPKTRMHALSRINITVFKIDSVAISFQNVLIKILKSQNLI